MSNLAYRSNTLFKANSSDSTRPDFAKNYTVTVYEVGAVANGAQTSNTITVRAGHVARAIGGTTRIGAQ